MTQETEQSPVQGDVGKLTRAATAEWQGVGTAAGPGAGRPGQWAGSQGSGQGNHQLDSLPCRVASGAPGCWLLPTAPRGTCTRPVAQPSKPPPRHRFGYDFIYFNLWATPGGAQGCLREQGWTLGSAQARVSARPGFALTFQVFFKPRSLVSWWARIPQPCGVRVSGSPAPCGNPQGHQGHCEKLVNKGTEA